MNVAVFRVAVGGSVPLTVLAVGTAAAWHVLEVRVLTLIDALPSGDSPGSVAFEFEAALAGLCAVGLLCCLVWLSLTSAAVVLDALLGVAHRQRRPPAQSRLTATVGRAANRCPATLRRLLLLGCGTAVAAGLVTAPATAEPVGAADSARVAGSDPLAGLTIPDRTIGETVRDGKVVAHVVRVGDSLWSIATGQLRPGATDVSITAAWHAIHRLNQDVIGPDPDLIRPGTALQIPADMSGAVPDEREESP